MDYEDMRAMQLREEGHDEPRPLVFTASDLEDADPEAVGLAMDRDMADRIEYWRQRQKTLSVP
jgi:hypothetical protein